MMMRPIVRKAFRVERVKNMFEPNRIPRGMVIRSMRSRTALSCASRSLGAACWKIAALLALKRGNRSPPNSSHPHATGIEGAIQRRANDRPPPMSPAYMIQEYRGIFFNIHVPST